MMINPKYANSIFVLANLLSERNVPFSLNLCWDGLQMRFPWNGGDIICHSGSYNSDDNYVESMGCPWDNNDVSCLSLEEAYVNIVDWYQKEYAKKLFKALDNLIKE